MAFTIYNSVFSELTTTLGTYVNDVATKVVGTISPVAKTLIAIYIMLWGWAMIRGMISEPVTDGVTRIVRLAIITGLAINIGLYNGFIADFLWASPDAIANVVTGTTGSGSAQFLDKVLSQTFDIGEAFWKKANVGIFPDFGLLIVAVLVWLVGVAATGYAAFLLALAKIALAILLGVGPIFVLLLMFDSTRRFFEAWLGQALNYVFLVMLTAAAIKLMLAIVDGYLVKATAAGVLTSPSISAAFPVVVLCIMAMLVMMQLSTIASALGGGAAISTLGAVGWAYGRTKAAFASLRPTRLQASARSVGRDLRLTGKAANYASLGYAGRAGRALIAAPKAVYDNAATKWSSKVHSNSKNPS